MHVALSGKLPVILFARATNALLGGGKPFLKGSRELHWISTLVDYFENVNFSPTSSSEIAHKRSANFGSLQ